MGMKATRTVEATVPRGEFREPPLLRLLDVDAEGVKYACANIGEIVAVTGSVRNARW